VFDDEETTLTGEVGETLRPSLEIIECRDPAMVGRVFPIGEGLSIGRRDSADLRLLDRSVSRDHARLFLINGEVAIADHGTTNGTFVNGIRVERTVLKVGDLIRLGLQTVCRFVRDASRWPLRLTDALIAARIALWEWDSQTESFFVSRNFTQVTGLAFEDMPGDPAALLELVNPEDQERVIGAVVEALDDGRSIEIELRLRPGPGQGDVWLNLKGQVARAPGSITIRGSASNISARKRAERELRRLTRVLENMSDAIVVIDLDGRITDWTSKAEATFGLSRADALGSAIADLIGSGTIDQLQVEASQRGHYHAEIPVRRSGRSERVFEVAAGPLRDDDGWIVGYVAAFRDVTEKRALQDQLVIADKMAAIGTLAAGIAHEINNPLAFVVGGLDWLAERLGKAEAGGGEVPEVLSEMRQGIARIASIVGSMKTLSRKDDHPAPVPVELRRVIDLAERIVANEVRQWARLRIDVPAGLHVAGNETRLMQVFINLIVNAIHAIQSGNPRRNAIRVAVEAQDQGAVTLMVRDTGCGMSPETLERLFTPFFTTKPPGKGTGLGLSVTRTIVEGCGGSISIESAVGTGTTVRVRLPLVSSPGAVAPAPEAARPAAAAALGSVLVIDDEPLVASALCRLLRSRGYQVESAADGRTGVELARTGRFDAVVCDLMMPGFSGVDLHDELAADHAALLDRILFLSGGAFSPREQAFVEQRRGAVLSKPWRVDSILGSIDEIVSRRRALQATARTSGPAG
jgi:PAS domain S-box-containing protein